MTPERRDPITEASPAYAASLRKHAWPYGKPLALRWLWRQTQPLRCIIGRHRWYGIAAGQLSRCAECGAEAPCPPGVARYTRDPEKRSLLAALENALYESDVWRESYTEHLDREGRELKERRERFDRLALEWEDDTAILSSVQQKVMHPAYQRVIGLGPDAVPLIMDRLERGYGGYWFWALVAITGEDPAKDTTRFDDAVQAWLTWWRQRGAT